MSVAEKMTAIADAIREKTGETEKLSLDGMAESLRKLPGPIVATAVGNPIALSDATDLKLRGLRLFGRTTQDGTPSPDNPVPLVSAGDGGSLEVNIVGKNIARLASGKNYSASVEFTENNFNAVVTAETVTVFCVVGRATFAKGMTYVISTNAENVYGFRMFEKGTTNEIPINVGGFARPGDPFIPSNDAEADIALYFSFKGSGNNAIGTTAKGYLQCEVGSTATEYEPYKEPKTITLSTPNGLPGITVTSGGNYTDETGQQWVCDEVDFVRGVYVQNVDVYVFTGNDPIGWAGSPGTESFYFFVTRSGIVGNASGIAMSNYFKPAPGMLNLGSSNNPDRNNTVSGGNGTAFPRLCVSNNLLGISSENTPNAATEAFKKWAKTRFNNGDPVIAVSGLATPIETPLSAEELAAYRALHTNYPNTTIINDGGAGMEVSYVADTKNYIDNQVTAMAAAIVNA